VPAKVLPLSSCGVAGTGAGGSEGGRARARVMIACDGAVRCRSGRVGRHARRGVPAGPRGARASWGARAPQPPAAPRVRRGARRARAPWRSRPPHLEHAGNHLGEASVGVGIAHDGAHEDLARPEGVHGHEEPGGHAKGQQAERRGVADRLAPGGRGRRHDIGVVGALDVDAVLVGGGRHGGLWRWGLGLVTRRGPGDGRGRGAAAERGREEGVFGV
jgi:hypothetical protein